MRKAIPICLFFLFPFNFLNAQDFAAKTGLIEEVYVFDGIMYEVYKTKTLKPNKILVSSTLKSDTNRYKKTNLIDNNPKTAWVEGVRGNGIGEKIRFSFEKETCPDAISFTPGYLNTKDSWYKNNRVSKFKIKFLTNNNAEDPNELISEITVTIPVDLAVGSITPNTYFVNVSSVFIQNMTATEFGIVEIEILDVDSTNAKYDDTCISEIGFYQRDGTKMIKTIPYKEYQDMLQGKE